VKINLSPEVLTAQWFVTLFSYSFPLAMTLKIWDYIFLVGWEGVFRIAVSILGLMESDLLALEDMESVAMLMKEWKKPGHLAQYFDYHELLGKASSLIIDEQVLLKLQESFAAEILSMAVILKYSQDNGLLFDADDRESTLELSQLSVIKKALPLGAEPPTFWLMRYGYRLSKEKTLELFNIHARINAMDKQIDQDKQVIQSKILKACELHHSVEENIAQILSILSEITEHLLLSQTHFQTAVQEAQLIATKASIIIEKLGEMSPHSSEDRSAIEELRKKKLFSSQKEKEKHNSNQSTKERNSSSGNELNPLQLLRTGPLRRLWFRKRFTEAKEMTSSLNNLIVETSSSSSLGDVLGPNEHAPVAGDEGNSQVADEQDGDGDEEEEAMDRSRQVAIDSSVQSLRSFSKLTVATDKCVVYNEKNEILSSKKEVPEEASADFEEGYNRLVHEIETQEKQEGDVDEEALEEFEERSKHALQLIESAKESKVYSDQLTKECLELSQQVDLFALSAAVKSSEKRRSSSYSSTPFSLRNGVTRTTPNKEDSSSKGSSSSAQHRRGSGSQGSTGEDSQNSPGSFTTLYRYARRWAPVNGEDHNIKDEAPEPSLFPFSLSQSSSASTAVTPSAFPYDISRSLQYSFDSINNLFSKFTSPPSSSKANSVPAFAGKSNLDEPTSSTWLLSQSSQVSLLPMLSLHLGVFLILFFCL
jgi:hypothetical protein